jgi:hypothetical protein
MMVRVRNSEGQYLARDPNQWRFSSDCAEAVVLDFSEHQVLVQLRMIGKARGEVLQFVPIDPREVHETCDRCGELESASEIFFDGLAFLCGRCRRRTSRRSRGR